ncbi:MAG: hypothetical protein ABR608_00825 [Pseudonocardiaceae bacterium]
MTSASGRIVVLRVTCARDGREHLVADEAMTAGSAGRYRALCGDGVWAAVLACPAGPPCPTCMATRRMGMADERGNRRRVVVWIRWLVRLRRRCRSARSRPARSPDVALSPSGEVRGGADTARV